MPQTHSQATLLGPRTAGQYPGGVRGEGDPHLESHPQVRKHPEVQSRVPRPKDSAVSGGDNGEISSACFVMPLVESWCPGLRQRDAIWFIIQLSIPVGSYVPQHPQIQAPNTQIWFNSSQRSKSRHTKNGRPQQIINKPQNSAMPSVSPPLIHLFIDGPLHL